MSSSKNWPSSKELLEWIKAVKGVDRIHHDYADVKPQPNPKEIEVKSPKLTIAGGTPKRRRASTLKWEVNTSSLKRVKRGDFEIAKKLDLHGYTQKEAYLEVQKLINASYDQGLRLVLVITGKGDNSTESLKVLLPKWLESSDLNNKILNCCPAHQKHGGDGAYYLFLRKNS